MKNLILIINLCVLFLLTKAERHYTIDGRKYIHSYPVLKNWYHANKWCREQGSFLIDINSKEEDDRILQIIRDPDSPSSSSYRDVWTSGTDLGSEGKFYWMSSGKPLTYSRWYNDDQPDNWNGIEHCVGLTSRFDLGWNDEDCKSERYIICREDIDDTIIFESKIGGVSHQSSNIQVPTTAAKPYIHIESVTKKTTNIIWT